MDSDYCTDKPTFLPTWTGIEFSLEDPKFHIEDIAKGLSCQSRFAGQGVGFLSVAEHSVLVADIIEVELIKRGAEMSELNKGTYILEGLLHDATEAYISDIPAQFKSRMPGYLEIERSLDLSVRKHFALPSVKSDWCEWADKVALYIEGWKIKPPPNHKGSAYFRKDTFIGSCANKMLKVGLEISCQDHTEAYAKFLRKFEEIHQEYIVKG